MNAFLSGLAQSACATVSLLCLFPGFSLFSPGTEAFEAFKNLPSLRSRSSKTGWAQQPGNQLLGEDRAQLSPPGDLHEKTEKCIPVHTVRPSIYLYKTAFILLKYQKKKNPTNQVKKSGWEYINPILDRSNTQLSRSLPCKFFSSTFLFKNEATYTLYYPHYPIKLSTKCTCKTCLTCFCMFLLKGE